MGSLLSTNSFTPAFTESGPFDIFAKDQEINSVLNDGVLFEDLFNYNNPLGK